MSASKSKNLGSAKQGVGHWWAQRVTAVALALLSIFFVMILISSIGLEYDEAIERLTNPFNFTVVVLFVIAAFYHASLGLQVVIEDYVSGHSARVLSILLMKLFVVLIATIALISLIVILIKAYS